MYQLCTFKVLAKLLEYSRNNNVTVNNIYENLWYGIQNEKNMSNFKALTTLVVLISTAFSDAQAVYNVHGPCFCSPELCTSSGTRLSFLPQDVAFSFSRKFQTGRIGSAKMRKSRAARRN